MKTYCSFMRVEELQKVINLCIAVMNEPKKEALQELAESVDVYCSAEEFVENKDGGSQRTAEFILYREAIPNLVRRTLSDGLEKAWYINHPKRELTEEEHKETARLHNELLCSNMADCPQWGQEAKYRAGIEKRLDEIYGTYDHSYRLGTRYGFMITEKEVKQ